MRLPWKKSIHWPRCARVAAVWAVGGAAVCAILAGLPVRAQEASVEQQRVAEVRIVDESGGVVAQYSTSLPLQPGKPFDFAVERDTLRQLYRTGDYADIHVAAEPSAQGLRVDFIVRRNFFNNAIRVQGLKEPPSEPAALASMRMGLGEPYRESALQEAIQRLKDTLRSEGLYQAKVSWALTPHEDTRQMDVMVTVVPGPRAIVGSFMLQNKTPYPDDEIIHRSKIKLKNQLTTARLNKATQRLKKYLVNQGYLGASALLTPGPYDPQTNVVPLKYDVSTGPRVRIELVGASLSKGKLRSLLPIYAEGAADEDLLQEGRRNVRDYFQRQGYFDADVKVSSHEDPATKERVISYEITRGGKFRLASVAFTGNKYFGKHLLESRLQLQPASFGSNGRFSQSLVNDDADSIRGLYLSNGFLDVKVTASVDDNYQGKKGTLFVSYAIVEGTQTLVADLHVEGNHVMSTEALLAVVGSSAGQPYSASAVASDRNNILAMYYNEGFPTAHFQEEVSPGATANEVRLTYHIVEGQRIEVAKVLVTGYQFTRPGVIAHQIKIKAEGPLREGDVVETQRRLYNLGVFSRVQIEPQNPTGTDPNKTVVVDLQEGKRYTIGYGVGFEVQQIGASCNPNSKNPSQPSCDPNATVIAESPRVIFEISRSNMFGRAQTLTFKARASTLEYRSLVSYTADNFWGHPSIGVQLIGLADKAQDVQTFTSVRYEGAFQVAEKFSRSSSILYRYFFRRVTASDLRITPDEIPLFSQPTLVSGFGITYARERRDNPVDAKRGTFNTVDLSVASTTLGSSASFFRGFFQNSSFHPFGRAFVFARATRFGFEQPLGQTTEGGISEGGSTNCSSTAPDVTEQVIPLPERFFAGGATTLRGFGLNEAGPRDPCTGFPIGGLAVLMFNQELRFPMKLPFIGNRLGGTILYDGGNVYSDVGHITMAWKPSATSNLNYFSHTVGFGFRYPTPIGPVRVDFGYQLNPAQYQATIPPATVPQFFRLPHFEFSFNIGPVF
ncbi:MAG TPA: POTRA domain-containing protein [Candidatus Sulfotelmatobacter sp.]|jgi:outer membrane protein insertion porin family|nr:POTRA domain-containing protein [Candidatus Sulfotelmatobacter sp.]